MNPVFKFQSRTPTYLFADTCQSHAGHICVHQLIEEAQLDQSLGTHRCHLYCKGKKGSNISLSECFLTLTSRDGCALHCPSSWSASSQQWWAGGHLRQIYVTPCQERPPWVIWFSPPLTYFVNFNNGSLTKTGQQLLTLAAVAEQWVHPLPCSSHQRAGHG